MGSLIALNMNNYTWKTQTIHIFTAKILKTVMCTENMQEPLMFCEIVEYF